MDGQGVQRGRGWSVQTLVSHAPTSALEEAVAPPRAHESAAVRVGMPCDSACAGTVQRE